MLCDDHLHTTPLSPDSKLGLDEACRAATAAGLNRICITNHLSDKKYYPFTEQIRGWTYNRSVDDLLAFKELIEKKRGEYPELGIGFGIEADYDEGTEGELKDLLDGTGFDFVLGSAHFLDGNFAMQLNLFPHALEHYTPDELVAAYFAKLEKATRSGLFDCLAHLDVFKRRSPESVANVDCREAVRSLARVMKTKGLAFEFNTARFQHAAIDFHPSKELRKILFEEGVRTVTIGSDAHHAEHVGFKCLEARDTAKKEGFQTVYFEKRKPVPY
ncbi:MAG: histidinol-phosphatase HisJ family protein [Candidatus Micrarchaeia archaeon]